MAALRRVNRMTGAGHADSRRDKHPCADVNRRGVKDYAVVVDNGQSIGVDIEAVITVKAGFNGGQGMAGAQKFLQNLPALSCSSGEVWLYSQQSRLAWRCSFTVVFSNPLAYAVGLFIMSRTFTVGSLLFNHYVKNICNGDRVLVCQQKNTVDRINPLYGAGDRRSSGTK